ncbi:MAG: LysM peptidoglycan-binding domain-containing protein [Cellulomonas sp.]
MLTDGLAGAGVDRLVETGVLGAGLVLTAWLALSLVVATLCATGRAAGVRWRAGERLVARCAPDLVRRALVLAVGAGIGLSAATGATAAAPGDLDLGWTATAATTTASPAMTATGLSAVAATPAGTTTTVSSVANAQTPTTEAAVPVPVQDDTVVVEPGDTLWHIAQRALPSGAGAADIASAWPAWYAANAALIGDDPDLLQPGQVLISPTHTPTDGAS